MAKHLTQIGGYFYYFRRVPIHLKPFDGRRFIRISLKTNDRREAERSAAIHNDFMEKYWADLVRSGSGDQHLERYRRARQMAQAHGFAYRNIAEVAEIPTPELLARIEAFGRSENRYTRDAFLGGAEVPQTLLAECLDLYWPLIDDRLVEKTDFEKRKYRVPRATAFEQFVEVVDNKPLSEVTRKDVLAFRAWLMELVASEAIAGATANKRLTATKDILVTVGRSLDLETEFSLLFIDTKFASIKRSRPPFETEYIEECFIHGAALDGMNHEAQLLFIMLIETGARPKEIIGLLPEDYCLDDEVPHVWIRKNRIRNLKRDSTARRIPLVGVSLTAAKQIASTGFTRYQAKPDHGTGAINKYLRENNLTPSKDHSLYSLRHSFKDRLREVEAPEELVDELMGHTSKQPVYGSGRSLAQKQKWLQKIAFAEGPRKLSRI